MPGLIDNDGDTGLAFRTATGLQFQTEIGTADLIIEPIPTPPSGEPQLDFSDANNSQYLMMGWL